MKIVYKDISAVVPCLAEVNYGQVFRPTNSRAVYMRLPYTAESAVFTAYEATVNDYVEPIQIDGSLDDKEGDEFIACIRLDNGTLAFLHKDTKVERLDCELMIKEGGVK
jgi:hypothetical protein